MIVVRVPGSSANLGPGFDALGMALTMHAELAATDAGDAGADGGDGGDGALGEGFTPLDERHPADIAFRAGGGVGPLWLRSAIPIGRGLGFSGAARIGGLLAAQAQSAPPDAEALDRLPVLEAAIELEGHADNVAASLLGGVVATSGGKVVPVAVALEPGVVVWVPEASTSTQRARAGLPATVSFADAAFNVGRTALLVAALAAGDVETLRVATEDRLHQDHRFTASAPSRLALSVGLDAGAWAGWLSGSGPAVALLCDAAASERLAAHLTANLDEGHAKIAGVDRVGAVVEVR